MTGYEGWSLDELFKKLSELQERHDKLHESFGRGVRLNIFILALIEYASILMEIDSIYKELDRRGVFRALRLKLVSPYGDLN